MSQYRRIADREESDLAAADLLAHKRFGRDESAWTDAQWREYADAISTIHADYPYNHRTEVAA